MAGRAPSRARLPAGSPVGVAPRRSEVSAKPLAGGGATGGRIYLDPAQFRDEWRRSRDGQTNMSVASDVAAGMSALDIEPGDKKQARAALQQFVANLQRVQVEHSKAPGENLLDPYKQAFSELIPQDPAKAAFILESAGLPEETVAELGRRGFQSLLAAQPRSVVSALQSAKVRPETARALIGTQSPAAASPAASAPASGTPASLPALKKQMREQLASTPKSEIVDIDPVLPAQPARSPVPIQKGDQAKILAEAGEDWNEQAIARGWRMSTYAAPGLAPYRVFEILADRWKTDLKPQPAVGARPNPELGQVRTVYQTPPATTQAVSPASRLTSGEQAVLQPPQRPGSALDRLLDTRKKTDATAQEILSGLNPEERAALERGQELAAALRTGRQISMGQEVAPNQVEGMQQVPLAADAAMFDDTQQGRALNFAIKDLIRRFPAIHGLIDTRPAIAPAPRDPLAPPDRSDFTVSLSHLMGGWDRAKPFFFEDRPPNVPPEFGPLIKQAENVRALEAITGQRFMPQLPAESSTAGPLNKGLTREDLPENYDQMTPAQKKKAREKLESKIEGSTGDLPVYGVGSDPAVAAALRLIDEKIPLAKGKRRIDLDKRESGLMGIEEDYPQVVAQVRQIMSQSDVSGGPIIMRDQTSMDIQPWERRTMVAKGRGALTRAREQLTSIIDGKSKFIPTVLRQSGARATAGLSDAPAKGQSFDPWASVPSKYRSIRKRTALEFVQRALEQGGIFPLDEKAGYWRGKFIFHDPEDGNVYYGRLTPGVLARTISQQLVQEDPARFRILKDMIRRSMEVYERLPPTKQAAQFLDETGAPRAIRPSKTYLDALAKIFQDKGQEFSPIIRMGNPWDDDAPKPQGTRRFTTISPVTGLTK